MNDIDKKLPAQSALQKLGEIPKVGLGIGGIDFGIGISHTYALRISRDVIASISDENYKILVKDILKIFDDWRENFGVYPPRSSLSSLLFGLGGPPPDQQAASSYIDQLIQKEIDTGVETKLPEAWECCDDVSNPIELFEKLWGENYKPINELIDRDWEHYPAILAILILLTDIYQKDNKSSDCIRICMKLSMHTMRVQAKKIETMEPHARQAFNRRQQHKEKFRNKREESQKKLLAAYERLKESGKPFNNKRLAQESGLSEPMVSRYCGELGITNQKKNCIVGS